LVKTANAIDEQEDFEYGAQVDGYSVSEELERRAQRLTKIKKAQAALDMDSQIIVANHIEDSVSDARAAEPVLERMEQNLGLPGKLVADAGYGNKDTLESCQERGVTRCAPRGGKGRMAKRLVNWTASAMSGTKTRSLVPTAMFSSLLTSILPTGRGHTRAWSR